MKKLILLISILFLFLCNNAFAARLYGCTSLTGGGTGALDALDITAVSSPNTNNLANGDGAIVVTSTNAYLYYFSAAATNAEDSPTYVRPDDYSSAGVWIKVITVVASEIQTLTEGFLSIGGCSGSVSCTAEQIVLNQNIDAGTGTLDIGDKTITFPAGGWYFTDENTSPSVVGQFKYDNTITGLDDGGIVWYDDDEVKYIADYATLPTTNGQDLTYNSSIQKWVPTKKTYQKCTTALAVTASSDWAVERFPFAVTITDIYVYQNGATNVIGGLDECTGANGTCGSVTAVDSDITGTDGAEVQDDGSLTNGGITAGNRVRWHTTSVSGTNTDIQICFDYTRD